MKPYALLDSGHGRKLESIGGVLVDRQAPTAHWTPALPESDWRAAEGVHHRSDKGGGRWEWRGQTPADWTMTHGGSTLLVKPTPFGHVGLFAEQAEQWQWITESVARFIAREGRPPEVLNLFAYTGGSTLAAARGGARVTHVDAARGVVDWARKNAALNNLEDASIRWIVDDCTGFVAREGRRERSYDFLILDPPSFGRGKKGEIWTIEKSLPPLLQGLSALVNGRPSLLLLSCHTPGYTPIALSQIADDYFDGAGMEADSGEMSIAHRDDPRLLPSGFFARRRIS